MHNNGTPTDFITSGEENEPDTSFADVIVAIMEMYDKKTRELGDHIEQLVFGLMIALQERDEPIDLTVEAAEMYQLFFDEYGTILTMDVAHDDEGQLERLIYALETPEDDSDDSGAGA
jgi:hypothetical protein